ncbi:Group XV phospholipase A2 [Toxocara canis]|uniref:Group XV phospholipase A2 n=1 Tax=Toxocara canis TaxID=6265 RepID=A0A0B2VRZ9_TOXCA|nr:Group XV phospholipase A2 [Toxocara canis]
MNGENDLFMCADKSEALLIAIISRFSFAQLLSIYLCRCPSHFVFASRHQHQQMIRLWISALLIIAETKLIVPDHFRFLKEPGYPIVLVPGDGGAQIEANLTGKPEVVHYFCQRTTTEFFDLWLNLESFAPGIIDCWIDNIKLVYNATTGTTSNMPGVDTRIPGFGNTEALEWLDKSKASAGRYFTDIVEMLISFGYRRRKSLMGAPFDWRKAPNELTDLYLMLKTMIETAYRYNDNKRVVIIAHSMGNPIMLYFYNTFVTQDWKDKYIQAHISLAGAWGGAMQIVRLFASGYNMDHYRILLPPNKVRIMQRSFTSSAFLFPSYNVWNESDAFAFTDTKNYSVRNVKEFFEDIKYEDGWSQYENTAHLLGNLDAPNVEIHCIYGYNVSTPEVLQWRKKDFPDYQPKVTFGDGDGTVNLRSLDACSRWIGNNGGKNVTVYPLRKADHMSVLQHATSLEIIRKVAYGLPT